MNRWFNRGVGQDDPSRVARPGEGSAIVARRLAVAGALHCTLVAGLLLVALHAAAPPARALFDDAEVRAMLFTREELASGGEPLVLLGWQSIYEMNGNGRRTLQEHLVWYVGDADAPEIGQAIQPYRVLHNVEVELFGLQHCRIYRGNDTLRVESDQWSRATPPGWPPAGGRPWADAIGELPPLQDGDVLDIAYVLDNRWNQFFLPADWAVAPLSCPYALVVERLVRFQHARTMKSVIEIADHDAKLRHHYGGAIPTVEVHTGDIPRGPADPTALGAPRVYFTSSSGWEQVRDQCDLFYQMALEDAEILFRSVGDSLATAHSDTRGRIAAVIEYIDTHTTQLPRSLTSSPYFPRGPRAVVQLRATDAAERGLLIAALASAAHMKADLFLARCDKAGFLPGVPTALQFDRLGLRVLLLEEDRMIWLDPLADSATDGRDAAEAYQLVLGTREGGPILLERTAEGWFAPYEPEE